MNRFFALRKSLRVRWWTKGSALPQLEGWIDVVDRHHVVGWAAYAGGVAPTLIICIDGQAIGQITPRFPRPDLARLYGENTNLGFRYNFPASVSEEAIVSVTDMNGQSLPNSPQPVPHGPEKPQLDGWIDVVDRHHVAGWAAYAGGVAPTLNICVDGKAIGQTAPKFIRPDLARYYGESTNLGFRYLFPSSVLEGAIVAVTDIYGQSLPNSPQPVPVSTEIPQLEGCIDVVDRYHVAGWAAYEGGIAPTLDIQIDGKAVGQTTPKFARPDLARFYGENTVLGFQYGFPSPVPEGAIVSLTDKHGQSLSNSPRGVPADAVPLDLSDVGDNLSTPIPEAELVFLVNGHWDRRQFAISRSPTVQSIIDLCSEAGIDSRHFKIILDFGCGCGRVLAGWEHALPAGATLLGCDINPRLVSFCSTNIPFARTWVSSFLPPLEGITNGMIDFVYAASVFTHVDKSAAMMWAVEMKRIIKPGGILMMSYSGSYFEKLLGGLSSSGLAEFKERGFYCHIHGRPEQTSPGSNDYATFMNSAFVKDLFEGFDPILLREGLSNGPTAFASYQDIAVLRRR